MKTERSKSPKFYTIDQIADFMEGSTRTMMGPFRLHDLRYTFAATGAGSNLGLLVIGKLLGHRRAETTSRYAHIAADPLKSAADAIASKLAAKVGGSAVAAKDSGQVVHASFKRGLT
jgi:integrase